MGYERQFESRKNGIHVQVHLEVGRLRFRARLVVNGEESDFREGFMRLRCLLGYRRHRLILRGEGIRADLRFNKKIANCYWLRRRSEWEHFVYGLSVFRGRQPPVVQEEEEAEESSQASVGES